MAYLMIIANERNYPALWSADYLRRSCHYRGDIFEVRDDNSEFGQKECLPNILIIKVPGSKEELEHLMKPEVSINIDEITGELVETVVTRRSHRFDIDANISKELMDEIINSDWLVPEFTADKIEDKASG